MAKSSTASKTSSVEAATQAVEFGASIREMRRAHNRELADVAATLKIRQVYLQAIEDGRFGDLPGPTYATGFIRAYADYLGLDLAEVMRRYREITGDQPAQGPLVPPSPVVEARLPTGFILLVAAVLALGAYGGWYYLTVDGRDPVEVVAKLPERIANMVGIDREASETPAPRTAETPAAPPVETQEAASPPPVASPAPVSTPANDRAPANGAATAPTDMPEPTTVPDTAAASAPMSPSDTTPATEAPVSAQVAEPPPASAASSSEAPSRDAAADTAARQVVETQEPATPATRPVETPAATVAATPEPEQLATATPASAPEPATQAAAPPASAAEPAPAAPQIAAVPVPESQGETRPASSAAASRVVLRANAITWVELRDGAGKRLYSRLMKRGETYAVPAGVGAVLETGNAGGLDIVVDGSAIGPIGPVGAVRRGVLLEADALLVRAPGAR